MTCWWRHKYSRWTVIAEGPIRISDEVTRAIGNHSGTRLYDHGWWQRQVRTCETCGWRQVKDTTT